MQALRKAIAQRRPDLPGLRSVLTLLLVALFLGPFTALASLAIEYGQALKVRSELQEAADAAVEAGARTLTGGEVVMAAAMRAALDAHLRRGLKGIPFEHVYAPGSLALKIEAQVKTRIVALLGKPAFFFAVTSSADLSAPRTPSAARETDGLRDERGREIDAEIVLERAYATPPPVLPAARPPRG